MGSKTSKQHKVSNVPKDNTIRICITGDTHAGKSTFLKQIQLRHGLLQPREYVEQIQQYIYQIAKILQEFASFEPELMKTIKDIEIMYKRDTEDWRLFVEQVVPLLQVELVQTALANVALHDDPNYQSHAECLLLNAEYFLKKKDQLFKTDYEPSMEDVLRVRVRTSGHPAVKLADSQLEYIEISGGRSNDNSRMKYIGTYDNVKTVLFLVNMNEKNAKQLQQHVNDLASYANHFSDCKFVVVANKMDIAVTDVAFISQLLQDCKLSFSVFPCSSLTGAGIDEVLQHVEVK